MGQSETAVRSMTDFFLLLMIPGAGDALQGIKRGIIEMLDGMVINKADGDNKKKAQRAKAEYTSALHLFPQSPDGWTPRVLTCSSLHNEGIAEVWDLVLEHERQQTASGWLEKRRRLQAVSWMRDLISFGLEDRFRNDNSVQSRLTVLEEAVSTSATSSLSAARELLQIFENKHEKR